MTDAKTLEWLWVRTGFSTPERAEKVDPEGEWYYVEGVRYCSRCQTRRCERQVGGSLPCKPVADMRDAEGGTLG